MTSAVEHLRQANDYYERILNDKGLSFTQQADCVKFAAHYLAEARKLDPLATLTIQEKTGPVTITQDWLSANLLFFQASREALEGNEVGYLRALETFTKASHYGPDRPFIHREIAKTLLKLNRREDAITAAKFALALNDNDFESRMLVDKIITTPELGVEEKIPGTRRHSIGWKIWAVGGITTFFLPFVLGYLGFGFLPIAACIVIGGFLVVIGGKIIDWGNGATYLHNALRRDSYE